MDIPPDNIRQQLVKNKMLTLADVLSEALTSFSPQYPKRYNRRSHRLYQASPGSFFIAIPVENGMDMKVPPAMPSSVFAFNSNGM